jgi:hypothetical protein
MAVIYVDDSRTGGSNNGTSWANAYLSISSVGAALNPGDQVFIASGHNESAAITVPGDGGGKGNVPQFYSVDTTGDPTPPDETDLLAGATIKQSSGNLIVSSSGKWWGVHFIGTIDVTFNLADEFVWMENCTVECGQDDDWNFTISSNSRVRFDKCTFKSGGGAPDNLGGIMCDAGDAGDIYFYGCTWDSTCGNKIEIIKTLTRPTNMYFFGCDFSAYGASAASVKVIGGNIEGDILMSGCKLPEGTTLSMGDDVFHSSSVKLVGCGIDENTSQEQHWHKDLYGQVETYGGGISGKAVYRTGGFTPPHQTNPISLLMTEVSNTALTTPHRIPIAIYNTATAATKTLAVEIILAHATTVDQLDYTQTWLEVAYYDGTGTLLSFETSQEPPIQATPTALAAGVGTGNWTLTNAAATRGSYKVEHTTSGTVGQEGQMLAWLCIGDIGSNTEYFADPMATIT